MIDWTLVDKEEEAALVAYAGLLGMAPNDFAEAILAALRTAESAFQSAQASIGGEKITLLAIDESLSPVEALIALGRRAAKSRSVGMSQLVSRHLRAYGRLYDINWRILESKARLAGIRINESDWVAEFLQQVPIITPYTPNVDAFVRLFPEATPKIVLSANLYNMFDIALVPLFLNILSEDGKAAPLKRRQLTHELVDEAADVIIATAQTYLHSNVRALDSYQKSWILRHTEIVDTIGTVIATGSLDFVLLHELSHIVFGHELLHQKRNEFEADNLAINCVLQEFREMGSGDDLLACFGAVGAAVAFQFFEVLDALNGIYLSDSHPPALFRRAALSMAICGAIAPARLPNYQGLNEAAYVLFAGAIARILRKHHVVSKSELADVEEFRVVVIPSEKQPFINVFRHDPCTPT